MVEPELNSDPKSKPKAYYAPLKVTVKSLVDWMQTVLSICHSFPYFRNLREIAPKYPKTVIFNIKV